MSYVDWNLHNHPYSKREIIFPYDKPTLENLAEFEDSCYKSYLDKDLTKEPQSIMDYLLWLLKRRFSVYAEEWKSMALDFLSKDQIPEYFDTLENLHAMERKIDLAGNDLFWQYDKAIYGYKANKIFLDHDTTWLRQFYELDYKSAEDYCWEVLWDISEEETPMFMNQNYFRGALPAYSIARTIYHYLDWLYWLVSKLADEGDLPWNPWEIPVPPYFPYIQSGPSKTIRRDETWCSMPKWWSMTTGTIGGNL